jgi:eukaryotic-like serine/threonine-protein kinase
MIGRVFSHYQIVRELGAGGMGEVYAALDTRLGRHVAIKFLPAQYTRDAGRLRRFEQEARAASALNHPNIITIYDIGHAHDARFIVMELIEGDTLRRRMSRAHMSIHEVLGISIQVADALAAAHSVGVIHRDIKPENIMIRRDGYVKVLDFGLAKLAERETHFANNDAPTVPRMDTLPGVVMGTASYMSPEQARGVAVDAPSDVFSAGVVMYESIGGRLPFYGQTTTDLILAILQTEPTPLRELSADLPEELERIVGRAMAKNRNERYQSAADLAADLRRLKQRLEVAAEVRQARQEAGSRPDTGAPAPESLATAREATAPEAPTAVSGAPADVSPGRRLPLALAAVTLLTLVAATASYFLTNRARESIDTLAVLPFVNAADDESSEYLSDGITESLINNLSQLPNLKVMSRSSVWRYKAAGNAAPPDASAVGRDLHVRAVLTGRVARHRDRLAISAELVDARDNSHIWGEQYDRSQAEVLEVQEEIASRIVERLRLKLSGDDRRLLAKRHTDDTQAYERYIRGRYYVNRRSADAIRKGREFFQQAIDEDPGYALAYAGLSDCYALLAAQGAIPPREAYRDALAAARKSIELDSELGEGHASLAHAEFHTDDWEAAEREFARAALLRPSYAPIYHWQSEFLSVAGRTDEAFAMVRKALELEPLDLAANAQLANLMIGRRDYQSAIRQLQKTLEIDASYFLAHSLLGNIYVETGRWTEAIAELETTMRLTAGSRGSGSLGVAYAMSGRIGDARRLAAEMEARAKTQYTTPMDLARIHAALHDREATVAWLTRARDEGGAAVSRMRDAPEFAFLRSDPRFVTLFKD